nr:hypothetical protein [Candidatus Paracaedibacter symbiosus]
MQQNRSILPEDYASGKLDDRPGLSACLKALWAGDKDALDLSIHLSVVGFYSYFW